MNVRWEGVLEGLVWRMKQQPSSQAYILPGRVQLGLQNHVASVSSRYGEDLFHESSFRHPAVVCDLLGPVHEQYSTSVADG